VLSVVLGGVITLIVSWVFYWRTSADLQHKVAALAEQSRQLELLISIVAGAMENRGLISVDRNAAGDITGLSVTVPAEPATGGSIGAALPTVTTEGTRRSRRAARRRPAGLEGS